MAALCREVSKINVRPNSKEAPGPITDWRRNKAMPGGE
jgi:hypothetical protein